MFYFTTENIILCQEKLTRAHCVDVLIFVVGDEVCGLEELVGVEFRPDAGQ